MEAELKHIEDTIAAIEKQKAEEIKFDFRDSEQKNRAFCNHGFTDDEMKDIVSELDRSARKGNKDKKIDNVNKPLSLPDIDRQYFDSLKNNSFSCKNNIKKVSFFGKVLQVFKSIIFGAVAKYRNFKYKSYSYARSKLPRIECTEEHFCERHQKEYDAIFMKFKKDKENNFKRP